MQIVASVTPTVYSFQQNASLISTTDSLRCILSQRPVSHSYYIIIQGDSPSSLTLYPFFINAVIQNMRFRYFK